MDGMFQRGHLVRRTDPAWGADARALRADADTFHFTNCAPQVGFFNTGSAPARPGSGGGRLWRALEDWTLDNAVDERKRVSVFTGPVLRDDDPEWRTDVLDGFRVPMRFWKIVAWPDGQRLRALAMIADQSPYLDAMPERFDDTPSVEDFLTTVEAIEAATGLDFGDALRAADVRRGQPESRITSEAELLRSATPRRATRRPARAPGRPADVDLGGADA
jgi:endonuclease G